MIRIFQSMTCHSFESDTRGGALKSLLGKHIVDPNKREFGLAVVRTTPVGASCCPPCEAALPSLAWSESSQIDHLVKSRSTSCARLTNQLGRSDDPRKLVILVQTAQLHLFPCSTPTEATD
jgi:hypothetical protein